MATTKKAKQHKPTKKMVELNYRHENMWEYLRVKIAMNGVKDNNKLAKQIFNYVTNHFTAKK